jgi:hypothetical protein
MLQKIKTAIYKFEEEYPVHTWKYGGMDVWPIFRSLVFVEARNRIDADRNGVVLDWKRDVTHKQPSLSNSLRRYAGVVRQKILSGFSREKSTKPVDVMFFGSWYFRTLYDGKFINRFFEPISEFLKEKHRATTLFVEYAVHHKFQQEYKKSRRELLLFNELKATSKGRLPVNNIREDDFFRSFVQDLDPGIFSRDAINLIAAKIEKIYLDSFVYERLFRARRPKYAFCLTFFNESMFAMLFAASKVGLTSVDVGHGFPIDTNNLIYNKLGNVPPAGYNTLPDVYWVWDDPVKDAMSSWISKQNHHQVIVGGNPWLEFSRKNIKRRVLSEQKVVLYTMSINLPEDYIIEALQQTERDYEWWIRLHPSLSTSLKQVEDMFKSRGILNYNLQDANNLALPELLFNCDVHISRNSSSIYESVFYGNRPVIIDEQGSQHYSRYIAQGKAFSYVDRKSKELVGLIRLLHANDNDRPEGRERYKDALDMLMKQYPEELDVQRQL